MKYLKYIMICFCMTTAAGSVCAQVKNIKERIKNDKDDDLKNNYSTTNCDDDNEHNFLTWLFSELIWNSLTAAQYNTMQRLDDYPQRISVESCTTFGTELTSRTNQFKAGMRYNRGIWATDFKYYSIIDETGLLKSIDWTVLSIRLPIRSFTLDYGIGYINVLDPKERYFKTAVGFTWNIPKSKWCTSLVYERTPKMNKEIVYLKKYLFRLDYDLFRDKKLHVCPVLEYNYKRYFDETDFAVFNLGLIIKRF